MNSPTGAKPFDESDNAGGIDVEVAGHFRHQPRILPLEVVVLPFIADRESNALYSGLCSETHNAVEYIQLSKLLSSKKSDKYSGRIDVVSATPKEAAELRKKAIGAFLREKRESFGKKPHEVARDYGVPGGTDVYRTWERGRTLPEPEKVYAFLRALGEEGRGKFDFHVGPILDMLRGDVGTDRADAFDGLAKVLEEAQQGNPVAVEAMKRILAEIKKVTDVLTR